MSLNLGKHKLLVIGIPVVVITITAAIIGITQFNKHREVKELVLQGNRYLDELDYASAISCYSLALNIDEKNRSANLALADCYIKTGEPDVAVSIYRAMLDNDRKDADAYLNLAELYLNIGEPDRARELMDEAARLVKPEKIQSLYSVVHPDAPTISLPSGSFTERPIVELSCDDPFCSVYYTLDGATPSEQSNPYVCPIVIGNGQTTIKAAAVNSSGFVSDTVSAEYNVKIEDSKVEFVDEVMKKLLTDNLHVEKDRPVMNDELESIVSLYIIGSNYVAVNRDDSIVFNGTTFSVNGRAYSVNNSRGLKKLDDIAKLPYLKKLVIAYQPELDISALSGAAGLTQLSLIGNGIESSELAAISKLTGLKELCLGWNELDDISKLSGLVELESLSLWGNKLKSIAAVSKMKSLTYLDISDNLVSDISPVSSLSELSELWMYGNKVSSIAPAASLQRLKVLMLRANEIVDGKAILPIYPHLERIDVDLLEIGE